MVFLPSLSGAMQEQSSLSCTRSCSLEHSTSPSQRLAFLRRSSCQWSTAESSLIIELSLRHQHLQALSVPRVLKKYVNPVVQKIDTAKVPKTDTAKVRSRLRGALQRLLLCFWLQHSSTTVHGQRFARCFAGLVSDLRSRCARARP